MAQKKNEINQTDVKTVLSCPTLDQETQKQIIEQLNKSELDKRIIEHEEFMSKGGLLGNFLGTDKDNAVINIGFIIIIVCFILLVVFTLIYKANIDNTLLTGMLSIISLSIGYIFGKKSQ